MEWSYTGSLAAGVRQRVKKKTWQQIKNRLNIPSIICKNRRGVLQSFLHRVIVLIGWRITAISKKLFLVGPKLSLDFWLFGLVEESAFFNVVPSYVETSFSTTFYGLD